MSFNIKNSFVSRAIVEDDKEKALDIGKKESEEVVIQEQYDPRTLYERLQEQKAMKEEKFLEDSRLSNQIKRVDAEEAEYFRTLSDEKEKLEYERKVKEQLELEEYRQAVESRSIPAAAAPIITAAATTSTITNPKPIIKSNKLSKNSIKGALFVKKKKRNEDSDDEEEEKTEKPADKKLKTSAAVAKATTTRQKENTKEKGAQSAGSLGLLSAYGDISSSDSEED